MENKTKCTECHKASAYIDDRGFIYCEAHGKRRQSYSRCRKMRPSEVKRIENGLPLKKY